ncbi:MAG: hypothetical protein A2X45_14600 [Lentisphaerae bacterium GWF2_50_93]|nr:MAG: hypothetical protein A2X45_14600 [Lentisphaerae bacterium GWF2_50_93]
MGNYTSETTLQDKAFQILDGLDVGDSTRSDYKSRIPLFLEYVGEHGFNKDSFLNFKRCLASRKDLSIPSKAKYLTVARVFLRELHRQGIAPVDVTVNVKSFHQSNRHKRFGLNQEEISLLLERLEGKPPSPENARLKAIIALLIFQGLRQIEIVRLDVEDIDLGRKTALILGKGRDDKEPIDLHPRTAHALGSYMDYCEIRSGALFVSWSNNSLNHRLTTKSLREIVKGFLKELQIVNTTHGFRNFYTTKLIQHFSNDLLTVQKYTRHRSVETLQVYNDNISRRDTLPKYYEAFNLN